jgi:hypothetical protein
MSRQRNVLRWPTGAGSLGAFVILLFAASTQASTLYWVEGNPTGMGYGLRRLDLDGPASPQTIIPNLVDSPADVKLAIFNQRIYIPLYTGEMWSANLDGSDYRQDVVPNARVSIELAGGVLDAAGQYSYFGNAEADEVRRGDGVGGEQERIFGTRDFVPNIAVALDERSGKLYWSGGWNDLESGTIERANLDGSAPETLITGDVLRFEDYSVDLAIDFEHNKLYWTTLANTDIRRSNLDGSQVETVVSGGGKFSLAIDQAAVVPEPGSLVLAVTLGIVFIWRARRFLV